MPGQAGFHRSSSTLLKPVAAADNVILLHRQAAAADHRTSLGRPQRRTANTPAPRPARRGRGARRRGPDGAPARLKGDTIPLLRRLWREWLSPHRGTLAVVLVLIALVGASTGLYPALIKGAFDAFDRKDSGALAYGPLIVIVVTSVRGFALFGQTVLTNRVVTRVEADMQAALYGHLIDADLAQLGRESPAAFTQRFTTDFAFIKEALTRISTVLLRDVAMLVGLVAALIWMDPVLTLVAAVTVPFVAGPIGRIGKKLRRVSTTTQEQMGATASLISESLQGVRIAKTYAMEGYLKGRAADAFDAVRRLKMKAANARGRLDPLLEVGGGFAVAARADAGRPAGDGGRAHGRRLHRLRRRPAARRPAGPGARHPQRDPAGGGAPRSPLLRPDGRGADDPRGAGRHGR